MCWSKGEKGGWFSFPCDLLLLIRKKCSASGVEDHFQGSKKGTVCQVLGGISRRVDQTWKALGDLFSMRLFSTKLRRNECHAFVVFYVFSMTARQR
mmetsp:Transcript_66022/g.97774  ORF Transcript_66022/g.97774 Transcript_66022/m.97774 type:complete len:96 (-) Transcript_66022:634-921(-)